MQRLALALGVTAITLCWGSVTRAQTAFYPVEPTCQTLPSWYPRGWELMVRYPCYYVYAPSYYSPARLLPLCGSLPAPACVDSRHTPGLSPAISASRLVVVNTVLSSRTSESLRCWLSEGSHRLRLASQALWLPSAFCVPVLGVLPPSRFVGGSGQNHERGSVVYIVINVPRGRSHRSRQT